MGAHRWATTTYTGSKMASYAEPDKDRLADLLPAGGLRLEPPAGAHPIDVSINVELQQIRGIVARPAGVPRLNAPETGFLQVTLIDEGFNETHRIFSTDVIINCYRQKQSLVAIAALYMLHAANTAVFIQPDCFFDPSAAHQDQTFHTVWNVFETSTTTRT
jgi:hypothetical protein